MTASFRWLLGVLAVCGCLLPFRGAANSKPIVVTVESVNSPAGPDSMGSSLTASDDGAVWLSWLESADENQQALKCARFDVANKRWDEARLIARGSGWFVNWADFPVMAARGDRMLAVWFVGSPGDQDHSGYHAEFSVSTDAARTWSKPQPLTQESTSVEFAALRAEASAPSFGEATVVDLGRPLGRVDNVMLSDRTHLIVWLEGADKDKEGGLYLRAIAADGTLSKPATIAPATTARAGGFPRIALLRGGRQSQLLLSFTRDGQPRQIATAIVAVDL